MQSGTFLKTSAAAVVAAATVAGAAGVAHAADKSVYLSPPPPAWNLLFGVTAVSQYISRGNAQSDGFAVQPWAELDVGPWYLGYWGSNTSTSLTPGSWEHDLSVGVRPTLGPLTLDIGYVRYLYSGFGDAGGEVYGKASITPVMPLTIGASVFYNPDAATTYVEANAKATLIDKWSVSGAVGSQDGVMSWNAGVTYAPLDFLSFDARYHSGPNSDKFVFGVSFATNWQAVSGGHY